MFQNDDVVDEILNININAKKNISYWLFLSFQNHLLIFMYSKPEFQNLMFGKFL